MGGWRDEDRDAGTADRCQRPAGRRHAAARSGTTCARRCWRGPEQFVQTLTEKLMIFALGRALRVQRHADGARDRARRRPPTTTVSRRSCRASSHSDAFQHAAGCPPRPALRRPQQPRSVPRHREITDHVHHQETSLAPHRAARPGCGRGAAAAGCDDPGAPRRWPRPPRRPGRAWASSISRTAR